METSALIMMLLSETIVTVCTIFYFYKAFTNPQKPIEDNRPEINRPDFT